MEGGYISCKRPSSDNLPDMPWISSFLFAMYINDLEETFELKGFKGIEIGMLKLMLLLYANDIILSESEAGLQMGLDILKDYCDRWKLTVNVNKTKVMIFQKGGTNRRNVKFDYNGVNIDIVNKFTYLGVVFTTGGSFSETHDALAGQALKAIFKLKSLVNKFTAGLGGSVGCAVRLETRRSRVQPPPRSATFFRGD